MIRVALDFGVFRLLAHALNWRGGVEPDSESVAAVRIYFYLTNPLITPTVAEEIEQADDSALADWKNYHLEEIASPDDFYRGCVKGMAERYVDYHPDPRDCRVVAEAECAKARALLSADSKLIRGLGGRSEAVDILSPSRFWQRAHVAHGSVPRIQPAESNPVRQAEWWRW